MSRRHLATKPAQHFSTAEKLAKRRAKRKLGPAALRREERRAALRREERRAALQPVKTDE
jgi:hypothetical protein